MGLRLRPSVRQGLCGAVLGVTVVLGLFSFAGAAGASSAKDHVAKGSSCAKQTIPLSAPIYDQFNSGMANSSICIFGKDGQLLIYGNSFVKYYVPRVLVSKQMAAGLWDLGYQLFEQNCAACHGTQADGVSPKNTPYAGYPTLIGLGPATYDFWIESGRMPAASTPSTQPMRRPARLDHLQALAISDFLDTTSVACPLCRAATPGYPIVQNLSTANLSDGAVFFALNCAACHTITGDGDALAYSSFAPSLRDIPATQVAEALRTGPGNMPVFTGNLTDAQLRDVVAYVTERIQHPQNPGGLGLGGIGPVAEGFVGLALGVGLLALVGFWIGDRS